MQIGCLPWAHAAEGFAGELSEDWSRGVLERGLPEPPSALQDGESVPVAWWIGPDSAAVLHVRRWPPEGLRDPDDPDEPWTEVDVELFGGSTGHG